MIKGILTEIDLLGLKASKETVKEFVELAILNDVKEVRILKAILDLIAEQVNNSGEREAMADDVRMLEIEGYSHVRVHNALKAAGIEKISQLARCDKRQLLRLPNMGRKSVNELCEALKVQCGITLAN